MRYRYYDLKSEPLVTRSPVAVDIFHSDAVRPFPVVVMIDNKSLTLIKQYRRRISLNIGLYIMIDEEAGARLSLMILLYIAPGGGQLAALTALYREKRPLKRKAVPSQIFTSSTPRGRPCAVRAYSVKLVPIWCLLTH